MSLSNIALKNILGNFKAYRTYFFATAFSVMVFFIFAMLIFHPALNVDSLRETIQQSGKVVEIIIFLFLAFFISYAIMSYARQRSKDYAMIKIMGATNKQIISIYFIENLIVFAGAILTGILLGMLFAKLFFMILAWVLDMEVLSFYFAGKALLLTATCFLGLFSVVTSISVALLNHTKLNTVLQFGRTAETVAKLRPLWAIIGLLLIIGGYYFAYICNEDSIQVLFFPIIISVIVGTFLFYWQSVAGIIHFFKRNKRFYYKGINTLWISDLAFRVRSLTGVMFFSTIVIAIGLTAISSVYAILDVYEKDLLQKYPYELTITSENDNFYSEKAKSILEKEKVDFKLDQLDFIAFEAEKNSYILFLNGKQLHKSRLDSQVIPSSIENNNALLLFTDEYNYRSEFRKKYLQQHVSIADENISFTDSLTCDLASAFPYKVFAVVNSNTFNRMADSITLSRLSVFNYDDFKRGGADILDLQQQYFDADINYPNFFNAAGASYYQFKRSLGFALFLSLFVGGIFFISSGSMLYFNFYNHLQNEKKKYESIARIGLSRKEIIRSSRIQMAILFFLPNLLAITHTTFALHTLNNLSQINIMFSVAVVLSAMFILQIIYFVIINRQYNKHLMANISCL